MVGTSGYGAMEILSTAALCFVLQSTASTAKVLNLFKGTHPPCGCLKLR